MNLYAFVGGNPINFNDPAGFSKAPAENTRSKAPKRAASDDEEEHTAKKQIVTRAAAAGNSKATPIPVKAAAKPAAAPSSAASSAASASSYSHLDGYDSDYDILVNTENPSKPNEYNVSGSGSSYKKHVFNSPSKTLNSDVNKYHAMLGEGKDEQGIRYTENTTYILFEAIDSQGQYRRYMTVNTDGHITPKIRKAAAQNGYYILHGIKSHAEMNMYFYLKKHNSDLIYGNHACDKPMCLNCETILKKVLKEATGANIPKTNRLSKSYHIKPRANATQSSSSLPSYMKVPQAITNKSYDSNGQRK
jgi:hypothetical protein